MLADQKVTAQLTAMVPGARRLRGQLPPGTTGAHWPGTSSATGYGSHVKEDCIATRSCRQRKMDQTIKSEFSAGPRRHLDRGVNCVTARQSLRGNQYQHQ
jgi:hypothetical protein